MGRYNLHKVIILGEFKLKDHNSLTTIALQTHGLRVDSLLYIDDQGSIEEAKDEIIKELKDQLYADQYEEETLKIKAKEAYNGKDVVKILVKYLSKVFDDDMIIYYYHPDPDVLERINSELYNIDGHIVVNDYSEVIDDSERDIKDIMKEQNLKVQNMIQDSQVSFVYFLTALVERILSR